MNRIDTVFIILSSILVLFMTPGLAFFYGGLVSKRNVVNTMLSVFLVSALAILLWLSVGYSMSFSGNLFGIIGNFNNLFFKNISLDQVTTGNIPIGIYSLFQMMFAIITPALFIGSVVGRIKFKFLVMFITFWSLLVYYPMVHMVWGPNGFLAQTGVIDFAGGTVVHINAGITAFVLAIFIGPRKARENTHYNLAWVLLGTTILWIGWYGFNAGSSLAVNSSTILAILTTTMAPASAMAAWLFLEFLQKGYVTLVGSCTGLICGLVGITPTAGYVSITGAFWIGIIASICSFGFISYLKPIFRLDDTLDAFGCHGISGIWGSLSVGLFASKAANSHLLSSGLFYGGGIHLLIIQSFVVLFTIVYVAMMSSLIILALKNFIPIRVTKQAEIHGLDLTQHGEVIEEN